MNNSRVKRKKNNKRKVNTTFSQLTFLGTSSAQPIPFKRNVSSMILQFSSGNYAMIDCGEGTQHQLKISSLKTGKLRNIFFTHLHGDHCYGIFGLLHSIRKSPESEYVLSIYGPLGIKKMIQTTLQLSHSLFTYALEYHEFHLGYAQFYSTEDVIALGEIETGINVYACKISHRIETFGYVFIESDMNGKLNAVKAKALGAVGKQLGILKSGKDITLENGTIVKSAEVVGPTVKGRKIAIMQDCNDCRSCFNIAQNCDIFIHECTYDEETKEFAIPRGHSTAKMAALNAIKVNAKLLMLTHFSSRFVECNVDIEDVDVNIEEKVKSDEKTHTNDEIKIDLDFDHLHRLQREAEEVIKLHNNNLCVVRCAADFMCVSMMKKDQIMIEEKLSITENRRYHFKHDLKYLKSICGLQKRNIEHKEFCDKNKNMSLKRKTSSLSLDAESTEIEEQLLKRKKLNESEPC